MISNKTWVVIPAYNESERIGSVIRDVKKYVKNIVVVDDGSVDNTVKVAEESGALVLKHVINIGKGSVVKTGCDFAVKKGASSIILIDADCQHDPNEIPQFLEGLNKADIVFGYRGFNENMPPVIRAGNWFINYMSFMLNGIRLKDTQSGYRAFSADAYKKIRWRATDYSMESEMVANVRKYGLRYVQIPIKTIYADNYKGTTIVDGVKIFFKMLTWRLFG